MKQYRAYLFDLYGTLADIHTDESRPALWKTAAAEYSARGAAWEGPALRRAYLALCAAEEARLQEAAPRGAKVELDLQRVFAELYRQKGVTPAEALVAETALHFRRASTTHLRAYAGARELLTALRAAGREVVLLSNAQTCFTLPELEQLGLTACFDRIFISSAVGFKKPDPRFFGAALAALDLPPDRCLMIGNDPVCDIAGAAAVGMDAVYIHSALSPRGPEGTGNREQGTAPCSGAHPEPHGRQQATGNGQQGTPATPVAMLPKMDLRALRRLLL